MGKWLKSIAGPAILSALLLATLAGCSLLRFGYSQFDIYAAWTVDDYFDLDPQQKQEFRARFDRLHEWHRYEQLPDYAAFLGSASARIQKGLNHGDATWIAQGIEERYRVLIRRGVDDAAALLMTITPAQLEALQRKWEKENNRFVREHKVNGNAEQQREARAERELKRIEDWAGDLNAEQEKKMTAMTAELPLTPRLRYEDRLRRQREFMQLMVSRGDGRPFAPRLRHFLLNWEEGRTPEYQGVYAEWRRKQTDFYLAVERMLTSQQRATLLRRLQRYADDFTRLAQRPAEQAAASR